MGKKRHLAFEKRELNIRRGVQQHPTQPPPPHPPSTPLVKPGLSWQGGGLLSLCVMILNSISLTRAPLQILY